MGGQLGFLDALVVLLAYRACYRVRFDAFHSTHSFPSRRSFMPFGTREGPLNDLCN